MRRIIGAALALVAGIVAADAQGIGYPPGVNPFNPQDMTNRSNPQDLLAPGGYNRQDLVRQPPVGNAPALPRREVTSVPTPRLDTPSPRYTVKSKPKKKKKPHHGGATAQR
jgi:outer membrane biosynthesis protein TonB